MDEVESLIKSEHDIISKHLNLLLNQKQVNFELLISFCDRFIENNHHLKEEELIFKKIQDHPRLQEGGPLCVLYFDLHMARSPVERVTALSQKLHQKSAFQVSEHLKELYAKKTPLNIPIEEHEAGRFLLSLAKRILAVSPSDTTALQEIFELYRDIQSSHFEKEESCFLKMVRGITQKEEQESMLQDLEDRNFKHRIWPYDRLAIP